MNATAADATLVLPADFDDRAAFEMTPKGYLGGAAVRLGDGPRYPVFFYDPVRLAQDLEASAAAGAPFVAEPGLIVVPEVTLPAIQEAVARLARGGYFDHLKPL